MKTLLIVAMAFAMMANAQTPTTLEVKSDATIKKHLDGIDEALDALNPKGHIVPEDKDNVKKLPMPELYSNSVPYREIPRATVPDPNFKHPVYYESKDTVVTKYSNVCMSYNGHVVCDSIGEVPARISRMYTYEIIGGEWKKKYFPEYERITEIE